MNRLNRRLLTILGLGWLAYALSGLVLNLVLAAPTTTILIERSYCSDSQWQTLVQQYETLYQQHEQKRLSIDQVILFSDLGQDVQTTPLTPDQLWETTRYGRANPQRRQALQTQYPDAELLTCS